MKIFEVVIPVEIKKNDPGLMTLEQYYKHRNPDEKQHSSTAYRSDIENLNNIFHFTDNKTLNYNYKIDNNYNLIEIFDNDDIIGFIYDNILYYNGIYNIVNVKRKLNYSFTNSKKVKYINKKLNEIKDNIIKNYNLNSVRKPFRTIDINNEKVTLHWDNKEENLIVLNNKSKVIAIASNEWNTTLIRVAKEYKNNNIGSIIGEVFIDKFDLKSGGYTPSGKHNAKKIWNNRVSYFIKNGWYSDMIKNDEITKEKVDNILKDFKSGKNSINFPKLANSEQKRNYLIYINNSVVILYDRKFFYEQNDKYIYGYALIRKPETAKSYIVYSFDYENEKDRRILSYVVLQIIKNENSCLDIGFSGSDYFETINLKGISKNKGLVCLKNDVYDLNYHIQKENQIRNKNDSYNELETLLIELAETKFN